MNKIIINILCGAAAFSLLQCAHTVKDSARLAAEKQVKLKAHDYYIRGVFLQQEERFNEALVQFYQALQYDSTSAEIYNSIAENHVKLGHFESALMLLSKALRFDPDNIESLYLKAECHFRIGQDDQSIAAYQKILEVDPYADDARQLLIFLHEKNGDEMSVARLYEQIMELYGRNAGHLEQLGQIYFKNRKYDQALRFYEESARLDSTNARLYYIIGRIKEFQQKPDEAERQYLRAIKLDAQYEDALSQLIFLYRIQKQWQKMNDLFQPVLQADSTNVNARLITAEAEYNLQQYDEARKLLHPLIFTRKPDQNAIELAGRIEVAARDYAQALTYYEKLSAADAKNPALFCIMAMIQQQQEETDQAIASYKKALEIDPGLFLALDQLTIIYRTLRQWERVIELHRPYLETDSTANNARLIMAESYYYIENYEEARRLLEPFSSQKNIPLQIMELLGRIEFGAKNYDTAIDYFRKILGQDEKNKFAWLFLGFIYSDRDNHIEAEQIYAQALQEIPQDAMIWSFYGLSQQEQKKYDAAIKSYHTALEIDPENSNAIINLPIVYEFLKMYARSDSLYERAIRNDPENDLLLNNYSYSLSERGARLEEALEMSKKAVAAKPENASYLDTIGWIYYKLGNYTEAEQYIKKSLEVSAASAVVLEHLGDVYYELKNYPAARDNWEQSLRMDGSNQQVKDKLEKIK